MNNKRISFITQKVQGTISQNYSKIELEILLVAFTSCRIHFEYIFASFLFNDFKIQRACSKTVTFIS